MDASPCTIPSHLWGYESPLNLAFQWYFLMDIAQYDTFWTWRCLHKLVSLNIYTQAKFYSTSEAMDGSHCFPVAPVFRLRVDPKSVVSVIFGNEVWWLRSSMVHEGRPGICLHKLCSFGIVIQVRFYSMSVAMDDPPCHLSPPFPGKECTLNQSFQ